MKRILCAMIALLLACVPALAETAAPDSTVGILLITPTPSPEPIATVFSSEDLIVTLPAGLHLLAADELKGYDAAVQADYPDTARTVFAASSADASAALVFSIADTTSDAASAAREAALVLNGSSAEITENLYGETACAGFSCAIGQQEYRLYYISNGKQLLIVGASGVDEAAVAEMLSGLIF